MVEIKPITGPKGTSTERIAVGMFNALEFNLHNGGRGTAPLYRLEVGVGASGLAAAISAASGRPDAEVASVDADYSLIEIATGKTVIHGNSTMHVDYDIPGSQQRFAGQRAKRDAEDRATLLVADAIRNRLASYFVAGT
ncbi:MAG: hypothetical protein ACLPX7_20655 [Xanthobacteraceae bacterium]